MEIPGLPSDNLYKFMATAGLVGLLAMGGYWLLRGREGVETAIENRFRRTKIALEQRYLIEELKQIRDIEKDAAKASAHDLKRQREIDLEKIEAERADDLLQYRDGWDKIVNFALALGAAFCFLLTVVGFVLWYARLQRFEDRAILQSSGNSRTRRQSQRHDLS